MPSKKKKAYPPLKTYRNLAYIFIGISIVLLAIIFYYTVQYVYIKIIPVSQPVKTEFNFVVYHGENELVNKDNQGIFEGEVTVNEYEFNETFPATGSKEIPLDTANVVEIKSTHSTDQPLVATTRLLTPDNVLFRINESVVVPAGGAVEVEVYPDNPETDINIGQTRFTIPGLTQVLQEKIYAETKSGFGLETGVVTTVTEEDITQAKNQLLITLTASEPDSDQFDYLISSQEIKSEQISVSPGDVKDEFTVALTVEESIIAFDLEAVKEYAYQRLESKLLPSQDLKSVNYDNLHIEIKDFDEVNSLVELIGRVNGSAVIRSDADILDKQNLFGMNKEEARIYLLKFETIDKVDVKFFPFWLNQVPRIEDHIIIEVE